MSKGNPSDAPRKRMVASPALIIVLIVVALFAILLAKVFQNPTTPATTTSSTSGRSLTSTRNDAVADYEAALKSGKPVYILFHSLTCDPCVEISGIADKVIPDYQGKVVFVNALTDGASGQELASSFDFQYIPTSFFISADGKVNGSFTGVLSENEMRARLDELIAK